MIKTATNQGELFTLVLRIAKLISFHTFYIMWSGQFIFFFIKKIVYLLVLGKLFGNFVDEVALEFPEYSARANFHWASRYYALKHPYP